MADNFQIFKGKLKEILDGKEGVLMPYNVITKMNAFGHNPALNELFLKKIYDLLVEVDRSDMADE